MDDAEGARVRMIIIGGFLGAGKTTLITNLARAFREAGVNVGLIMNDQADSLVDTQYAEALGLRSEEVSGGCFCCRFPEFMRRAEELIDTSRPQMLIAEPVGSCTDLLATVVAPLRLLYPDRFEVAPLIVLVDAARVLEEGFDRHSVNGYLRAHQLEEAEVALLSKADLVDAEGMAKVRESVRRINADARLVRYSAITDEGFQEAMAVITSKETSARKAKNIDYEVYARAEAELGWYNGTLSLDFGQETDAYELGKRILEDFSERYPDGNIAHAKLMITSDSNAIKLSSVQGRISIDAAKGTRFAKGWGKLTLNARVVSEPIVLRDNARAMLARALGSNELPFESEDYFSPSPPKPFHRMTG